MATSIEQIRTFLDEYDLEYRVDPAHDAILIGFRLDPEATTFRDGDGDPYIRVVIRVLEDGEFLGVFCPQAWNIDGCQHAAAVFEALAAMQAQHKTIRFDYDPTDGEIRPNVELPVEDAELTSRQFHRLVHSLLHAVQRFDMVLRRAAATGEVTFAAARQDEAEGPATPAIGRLRVLAEEAGGVEALEQIACGAPVEEAGAAEPPPAATAERPPETAPRPVIRRLWERLFGGSDPEAGTGRKAG